VAHSKHAVAKVRLVLEVLVTAGRWPIADRDLDDLDLDLRNVRVPGDRPDEPAIVKYLVEATDVLGLARDILRDGYLDNELPVIAQDDGKDVVLEGNRRIAALKLLARPALLGEADRRVDRLKSRYHGAEVPTTIRVMIAPSRQAAQPLLARLHTKNPKRSWLREQQAVFYHAQLSSTVTVDDLRVQYEGVASSIPRFIRMGEMRALIRSLRYDDADLERFVMDSELKMTSFEYAYSKPEIQKALGLDFRKDGLLSSHDLSEGQRRGLLYLLGRFKARTLNTRSSELQARHPNYEPFVKLLKRNVAGEASPAVSTFDGASDSHTDSTAAGAERSGLGYAGTGFGEGGDGGRSAGTEGLASSGEGASGVGDAASRVPNRGDTRSRLDMSGFQYNGISAGLRRRFEELSRLDVSTFPNATHDLLRTIFECSIKQYFRAQGSPMPPGSTLANCVTALAREFQADKRMTSLINPINRSGKMTAAQYQGSTAALNASNHEPDQFVDRSMAHAAWDRIKPIVTRLVGQ
jgi:hypothetical protein